MKKTLLILMLIAMGCSKESLPKPMTPEIQEQPVSDIIGKWKQVEKIDTLGILISVVENCDFTFNFKSDGSLSWKSELIGAYPCEEQNDGSTYLYSDDSLRISGNTYKVETLTLTELSYRMYWGEGSEKYQVFIFDKIN